MELAAFANTAGYLARTGAVVARLARLALSGAQFGIKCSCCAWRANVLLSLVGEPTSWTLEAYGKVLKGPCRTLAAYGLVHATGVARGPRARDCALARVIDVAVAAVGIADRGNPYTGTILVAA